MRNEKPNTEDGYAPHGLSLVRKTCLYVATKLGDLLEDTVVVGGVVPSLLVDENDFGDEYKSPLLKHVGTRDLDLGLSLGLLDKGRYKEFAKRLREAGFENDVKPSGEERTQRWVIEIGGRSVEVDFLMDELEEKEKKGGEIINIEDDFSAVVTPGLSLAFDDYEEIEIMDKIPGQGTATREVNVAGPAAFIVLKALAFDLRGANKDAYDLFYVLRNYGGGKKEIVQRFKKFADSPIAMKSLKVLEKT